MSWSARVLCDSVNPVGCRLTTFELTYPRFIHAEFMTHREFSRNASSSRAIPIRKMMRQVLEDPAAPIFWGANQKGMQADQELSGWRQALARRLWYGSRGAAVGVAWLANKIGLHKQIANRVLEPWMWITVICSSTSFENFFHLRDAPDAQPEIRYLAQLMRTAYDASVPRALPVGAWHLPLIQDDEWDEPLPLLVKVSVGRCARVSYLTHDGRRDRREDVALHDRLAHSGHWSPFEHVAVAWDVDTRVGNFEGFGQYRKVFPLEHRTAKRWLPVAA